MRAPVSLRDLTEKEWSAQVYELARTLGWRRYHTYRSERSPAGFPDEVLARDRVVFLELKREKEKPKPLQVEWLTALASAGAEVYLARPSDLDVLGRVLAKRWKCISLTGWGPSLTLLGEDVWTPGCLWLPAGRRADAQNELGAA